MFPPWSLDLSLIGEGCLDGATRGDIYHVGFWLACPGAASSVTVVSLVD